MFSRPCIFNIIGCGQNVSHHSGMIISPNIMGVIPNNVMCSWTLDGGQRAGRGMSLKFYTNFTSDPRITPGSRSEDYITVSNFTSIYCQIGSLY
ncbi:hypothetical protein DPMN_181643 [Dreissena polymorpha]|uniref:CUB domain-containing protein n=1 Tax=Dreissena polymorpha TaxID=45954 RepID=A0A9D4I1U8_DREPO|nr:hypothetical protein DPMN_181643 [Dreissena polymorpha]